MKLPKCEGCQRRQEKIAAAFESIVDFIKQGTGGRPPLEKLAEAARDDQNKKD